MVLAQQEFSFLKVTRALELSGTLQRTRGKGTLFQDLGNRALSRARAYTA